MNVKKLLTMLLAVVMVLSVAACTPSADPTDPNPSGTTPSGTEPSGDNVIDLKDAIEHESTTSVYDEIGQFVTIDMVTEDPDTGLATITYEGKTYEAGMDFLSMAMVYNCTPAGEYKTAEEVYNQWWKLYIQRWNYLVPEIPLYSNQYFDLYNAKIENFVTSPYWGPADAIIAASVKEGEANSVILGNSTELSGAFRNSSWGKSSPGAGDLDIQNLTSGYATMMSGIDGSYNWNMQALAEVPTSKINEDGTITFTIKVRDDMVFSDGSPITAKNYIVGTLANANAVGVAAGGTGQSGSTMVGFDEFNAFDGTNDGAQVEDVTASKYFSGIKLLDDYTFSLTYQAEYANYYYVNTYAAVSPNPMALYAGDNDIITAEDGSCGLSEGFYAKTTKDGAEVYVMADVIKANLEWDSGLPYSGPYVVANYDESARIATLKLNPLYPGDDARGKASIETITYIKIESETQNDKFAKGEIDVLAGITGGDETKAALKLVEENPEKFAETHYDRAGYGKMGIRCDFGPTSMVEVRQAMIYTLNRPEFAQTFTGGYGAVVHGPYYTGFSAYKAVEDEINLNQYAYSASTAVEILEEGGWIYNAEGKEFVAGKDAVRYKKLSGYEKSAENLQFATVDGKYKTVKIDGEYYMPLAINWYGTQPNNVTDLLITAWGSNPNATTEIGMYIQYISTDFNTGMYGELYRIPAYGYNGTPKLNCVNFATGFNSAIYDFSFNWSIDPYYFENYSNCFIKDEADFWENYN